MIYNWRISLLFFSFSHWVSSPYITVILCDWVTMLWISQAYMCICMLILCAQSVPGKLYSTINLVSWPCFDSFQTTQMPKYQNINLFDEWNCCLHTCVYVTLHRWLTTPNMHCMRYFDQARVGKQHQIVSKNSIIWNLLS